MFPLFEDAAVSSVDQALGRLVCDERWDGYWMCWECRRPSSDAYAEHMQQRHPNTPAKAPEPLCVDHLFAVLQEWPGEHPACTVYSMESPVYLQVGAFPHRAGWKSEEPTLPPQAKRASPLQPPALPKWTRQTARSRQPTLRTREPQPPARRRAAGTQQTGLTVTFRARDQGPPVFHFPVCKTSQP